VVLWVVAGVSLLLALMALSSARRLSRKLETLSQSYWELRYDYTRLRAGHVIDGPAVIQVPTTTVVVPKGMRGTIDRLGNLSIATHV